MAQTTIPAGIVCMASMTLIPIAVLSSPFFWQECNQSTLPTLKVISNTLVDDKLFMIRQERISYHHCLPFQIHNKIVWYREEQNHHLLQAIKKQVPIKINSRSALIPTSDSDVPLCWP